MRKASPRKTCISCAKEYIEGSFYVHRSDLINEKFSLCKKCAKAHVKLDDLETLQDFLRVVNIPYKKKYWQIANESVYDTLGTYMKNMNSLSQVSTLTYKESDELEGSTNQSELNMISKKFEATDEMYDRWGRTFKESDIIQLETVFRRYGGYEVEDDVVQTTLIENISKTQFTANKALSLGDTVTYEKMMRVISMLLNDANMKPIKSKTGESDGKTSLGEWVAFLEETHPIDNLHKEFKDEQFIFKYFYKFFITQIKRIFGKATKEEVADLNSVMDEGKK